VRRSTNPRVRKEDKLLKSYIEVPPKGAFHMGCLSLKPHGRRSQKWVYDILLEGTTNQSNALNHLSLNSEIYFSTAYDSKYQ